MSGIVVFNLYPRQLGINGDVGNVLAVAQRATWRGMPLTVVDHDLGEPLPSTVHFVHIGSGPMSAQRLVRDDLHRIAADLRAWADDGVPFLAIAGGWQLLGRTLTVESGETWEGAGVFPSDSVLSGTRIVGEVFTDDAAGFENHSAQTVILEGEEFAGGRGLCVGDRVATTLHGPFLPMNPSWADRLLSVSAARAGVAWGADDERLRQVDEYAARSREAIRARLGV